MKARKKSPQLQSVETEERLTVSLKTLAQLLDAHRAADRFAAGTGAWVVAQLSAPRRAGSRV